VICIRRRQTHGPCRILLSAKYRETPQLSGDPIPFPARPSAFIHPLLRARDWQDRPEFGELCQWWKGGGVGVCALVGIGGAGKTAIAERFLQVLPGGYPPHPKVPKDRSLAAPARLLVFSFYDAPNPDKFFNNLGAWLKGRPPAVDLTPVPSYQQTLELLAKAGKCLLVLDGLEKVQDDGSRGGAFGQILDGRLRDFVLHAADGWLPQASLVITSRFRLFDPQEKRTWYYRQILVEQLQPPAAVQLLRDRGMNGTDDELERVAQEQGFHALSVDLVGGYSARFFGGDPERFSSLTLEPVDAADPGLDPRIAAIREQERKFARVAERYHEALSKSDPAALALLQRVCLFRLGVEAKTLASIFTGGRKKSISGPALAGLNEQQLQAKLQLLVEMRLVEASKSQISAQRSQIYKVHPAVRDGFLKKLDAETARLGHDAARLGLEASLGGRPGGNPSDLDTLDLLEEVVYHTIAAGYTQGAWEIYWYQIGGSTNLGRRLGAFDRGDRICRAFVAGQSPTLAPLPIGLPRDNQATFMNEWAIYLTALGQLASAIRCYERNIELRTQQKQNASIGNLNLGILLALSGRLKLAVEAAEYSVQLSISPEKSIDSFAHRAYVRGLLGEINASLKDFAQALKQQETSIPHRWLWGISGIAHCTLLSVIGRNAEATQLVTENLRFLERSWSEGPERANCRLLIAELARQRGDVATARGALHLAQEWALQHDAKRTLCWSALVRAKIELTAFGHQQYKNQAEAQARLRQSALALENGLRIARQCGYGLYHIDFLLVRAQLALREGRAVDAERDVHTALERGVHPPAESGFPELIAATNSQCLYAWGIAEGRHLLAEAMLLQAGQKLGRVDFAPKLFDSLPSDVRDLIEQARMRLAQALDLWHDLKDPESGAEMNPDGEHTKRILEGLASGILTEYPLEVIANPSLASPPEVTPLEPTVTTPSTASVFVCYAQKDNQGPKRWLDRLLEHLSPLVRQEDLAVWSDQQLEIGDEWNREIQKQLGGAKVAVLLVSPAFLASKYIANSELPVLLKRRREDGLKILPVLLSPSLYDKTRFKWPDPKTGPEEFTLSSLQAAGSPKKTLSEMTGPQRNRAFVALAERILEIVGENP